MRTTRLGILAFAFSLTSCGPPAEKMGDVSMNDTAVVESAVTVALRETQLATDVATQSATDAPTPLLTDTSIATPANSAKAVLTDTQTATPGNTWTSLPTDTP